MGFLDSTEDDPADTTTPSEPTIEPSSPGEPDRPIIATEPINPAAGGPRR